MTEMPPITPLPTASERQVPEPLTYQFAGKAFLATHKARELGPEGAARYAEQHWERVRLVCATPDDDDAFYHCGRPYLVLNAEDFGIAIWRDTQPMAHALDAEPWDLVPPDVPAWEAPSPRAREHARELGELPKLPARPGLVAALGWAGVCIAALALAAAWMWGGK